MKKNNGKIIQINNHEKLISMIFAVKKRHPKIGVSCFGMPLDEAIDVYNATEVPTQFKPKSADDVKKICRGLKSIECQASIHLPNLRYDEKGHLLRKDELIAMLSKKLPGNAKIVTVHLGWKDADKVLNTKCRWLENEIADNIKKDLTDLFVAGIKSGKIMTLENLRFKPHKHQFRELLSSRWEHLKCAREMLNREVAAKLKIAPKEIALKTGFTFDAGHASGNAHLNKKYTLEGWLKTLGRDIKLIHIHDMLPITQGGVKIQQTHTPLGQGIVDWKKFFKLQKRFCPKAAMVIELPENHVLESLEYLKKLK